MPFIDRLDGRIISEYNRSQHDGQEFIAPDDPEFLVFLNPPADRLDVLEALIKQGQAAMASAPLPLDIQKEIYDLKVFIDNYYRWNAITLIVAAIESFAIPQERQDVTNEQRAQVEALKTQMLAVFGA